MSFHGSYHHLFKVPISIPAVQSEQAERGPGPDSDTVRTWGRQVRPEVQLPRYQVIREKEGVQRCKPFLSSLPWTYRLTPSLIIQTQNLQITPIILCHFLTHPRVQQQPQFNCLCHQLSHNRNVNAMWPRNLSDRLRRLQVIWLLNTVHILNSNYFVCPILSFKMSIF